MDKRTFLKQSIPLAATALVDWNRWEPLFEYAAGRNARDVARDESFWAEIRKGYRLKPDYINYENGYYCFVPEEILEKHIARIREINFQGSYYMRTDQFPDKEETAAELASAFGCSTKELVITRNTTESLDLVIQGFDWNEGDEAVMAHQDYGAMLDHFDLMAQRCGIVNKRIDVPLHPRSDEEIVELYEKAITPKTRLLMVCHMINITGQILPVRKIADMARKRGVQVMVDGAHAIAHFRFRIDELNCDYYGASLHKWLSAPLGAGLLYVRKERIAEVYPLLASSIKDVQDVKRLNHTGTHPVHTVLAINDALQFYQRLGPEVKEARLRHLQHSVAEPLRKMPHAVVNTPAESGRACGILNAGIKDMKPSDLADRLLKDHRIYCVPIDYAGVHGCRLTPNVYTSAEEAGMLVEAFRAMG
jgi:selenocysteine lyase/cysteine desulfurase